MLTINIKSPTTCYMIPHIESKKHIHNAKSFKNKSLFTFFLPTPKMISNYYYYYFVKSLKSQDSKDFPLLKNLLYEEIFDGSTTSSANCWGVAHYNV